MPDIFSYEIVEVMRSKGCPLCRALAIDDVRWVENFRREGRNDPATRADFFAGGGFCRHHAWLFHRLVVRAVSPAAIADAYGWLAEHDVDWLADVERALAGGRRRGSTLERARTCAACRALSDAIERKIEIFVGVVSEPDVRAKYQRSDGLCFNHLRTVIGQVRGSDAECARFLLRDWRRRLEEIRARLADLERRRDYRYKDEPTGKEQDAWSDVIALYVGQDFTEPDAR